VDGREGRGYLNRDSSQKKKTMQPRNNPHDCSPGDLGRGGDRLNSGKTPGKIRKLTRKENGANAKKRSKTPFVLGDRHNTKMRYTKIAVQKMGWPPLEQGRRRLHQPGGGRVHMCAPRKRRKKGESLNTE